MGTYYEEARRWFPARWRGYPLQQNSPQIHARLFVHGSAHPTLIVNDVKTGRGTRGRVALWINPGTVAHVRDVRVTPAR